METGSESGCMQKTVRGLFIAFNILFCIIGVILIGVGSYAVHKANTSDYEKLLGFLSDKPDFDDVMDNDNPSPSEGSLIEAIGVKNGLLAVGGFIITLGLATFMISTCGWLGACRQNACMLFTFSIVMIVIVLIELILGIVAVVVVKKINGPDGKLSEDIAGSLLKSGDEAFNYHGNDTKSNAAIRDAWDTAQTHGECCGVNNPLDWMNASFTNLTLQSNTYPASCIDKSNKTPNTPYEMGCWQSVKQVLGRMSGALGGTAIFFCLVEIFGVVISCYLAFNMRKGGSQYEQH